MTAGFATRPTLAARPLTAAGFARFGTVIDSDRHSIIANAGTAHRYDVVRQTVQTVPPGYDLVTSIFDTRARDLPLRVDYLERHRFSPQIIMPVSGLGYLTIVCDSDDGGAPALDTLCAFFCTQRQGIMYHNNIWHHPIASVRSEARYLVQSWQNGSVTDCEECATDAVMVTLEERIDERI